MARPIDPLAGSAWSAPGTVAGFARSATDFRRALREAARVARPAAGLFVFTFSRNTFPPDTEPVPGEPFVFTQFSGQPQLGYAFALHLGRSSGSCSNTG